MHRFYLRLIRGNRKLFQIRYFEFVKLNKAFVELQKEIVFNSIQLVRFLSILFISFSVALTYLECVLFLAWMPILYVNAYLIIYVAHLISLSALIQYGSKIEYLNRNFLRFNRKCLCNEHHFFNNKYLLKVRWLFIAKYLKIIELILIHHDENVQIARIGYEYNAGMSRWYDVIGW